MPNAMIVTALIKTIEVPYIPVTRAECKASKYLICSSSPIPMRSHTIYHFHITTGSNDDKPI
ncbi:unnamed protein product [Penicillium camemberti]|uniref:Str. FM013 n=1 Tax=Penicillium camemberti (strain FM 013) TaxID=1429867 RepID=A0A0G4PXE8_PENC3|nr:unnamed protein product [Penicillium camemberti]